MPKISLFGPGFVSKKTGKLSPSVKPVGDLEFEDYLEKIKEGYYQDEVLHYRAGRIEKLKLPGVTPSGVFSYRSRKNLSNHSGLMVIDIDKDDQMPDYDFKKVRLQLMSDPYIYALHLSCSGDGGLAAYVKIDPAKHYEAFEALEKYFADEYELIIDQSGKDVSRFRFVSYDPDLYYNDKSKKWTKYIPKKKAEPRRHNYIFTDGDLDHVFAQITARGIDLTYSYHDWFRVGCAISSKYGSSGLDLFHQVSSQSQKYDAKACDKLYDILLKRGDRGIEIGTFLWMCQQHGIETIHPETKKIIEIARARKKMVGTTGGSKNIDEAKKSTKKYLKDVEHIFGKEVDNVIDQVMSAPLPSKNENPDELITQLEAFLSMKDLKKNIVTNQIELNGEPLTDYLFNSIYIESKKLVSNKVTKDLLMSLIDSERTRIYHPFKDFFEKHKHLKPDGNIDELISCFEFNNQERADYFIKKWLISIVSSAHGIYSLLILVLTGDQSTGKTKFFRNLLPDDLMSYYGESKLDDGKDSEILMTKKLLIVDDEFSGKSKKDYKKLKDLSSKEYFNVRHPYGKFSEDLKRYAVLAGSSNEKEIINDPTGNRRIIAINVKNIDHEKFIKIDKIDLWMELYHEWKKIGDDWMLSMEDVRLLNDTTLYNKEPSLEEELLTKHFKPADLNDNTAKLMTHGDIYVFLTEKYLGVKIFKRSLSTTLEELGFEQKQTRKNGVKGRYYFVEEIYENSLYGDNEAETNHTDNLPF